MLNFFDKTEGMLFSIMFRAQIIIGSWYTNEIQSYSGRTGPMTLLEAYIITFTASFCSLVIEMVAGRILAPFVGVSIYTWTSIIGVILAGISIGAFIGGKLIDRFPTRKTLGWLLLISGITALTIIPLTHAVAAYRFPVSLMARIFIITSIIFFIPGCVLGTISPVVVRLTLKNLDNAGNTIGKIYALSTLGAIIGTFVTGFFLISWMGTRTIVLVMGIILILASILSGSLFRKKASMAIFIIIAAPCLFLIQTYLYNVPLSGKTYFYKESDYYTIKLSKTMSSDKKTELEAMVLDNLIHSYVNLKDPTHIEYEYERIYADVLKWKFDQDTALQEPDHRRGRLYLSPLHGGHVSQGADRCRRDRPACDESCLRSPGPSERHADRHLQYRRQMVCYELQGKI